MKVVIVGPAHPYRGGLATFSERLAREFIAMGHEMSIYTFTLQYPNMLFPGKTQYTSAPPPEDLNIIRCINSINPFSWPFAGRAIQVEEPDLIIINYWIPFIGPSLGSVAKFARQKGKTKILALAHNIIPHEKRPGDKLLTDYFIKRVDGIIALSRQVVEDSKQFDTVKPRMFSPHPIFDNFGNAKTRNNALAELGLPKDQKYLLFFGFVREYKGLDLLIKALAESKVQNMDLKLIVAGEFYSKKEPYLELIAKHGLEDQIHLYEGFISDEQVSTFFSAADLVVQPYKSATQSGVTQIAYHFNKPMIVTNVGGLPEMCPDGKVGYIVEPDPGAIADGIARYFDSTDQDQMQLDIVKEKEKYSWSTLVENILDLTTKI